MSYDKYGKLEHINPDTLSPGERLAFEAWINTSYVTGFTVYKEAFFAGKSFPDAKPLIEALEEMATGKWGYLAQRAATIALKSYNQ